MKKTNLIYFSISLATFLMFSITIQGQRFEKLDNNPHDIVYFRTADHSKPQVKVVYGRPSSEEGNVFGTQVPYGQLWSTGTNESTEIQFYCDVMFGNKYVKAGKYVLYTIPEKTYWTVILNEKTDTYGAHFYDPKYNIAKIEVPVLKGERLENFSIGFNGKNYGTQMILAWAQTRVKIPLYTEESLISKI